MVQEERLLRVEDGDACKRTAAYDWQHVLIDDVNHLQPDERTRQCHKPCQLHEDVVPVMRTRQCFPPDMGRHGAHEVQCTAVSRF